MEVEDDSILALPRLALGRLPLQLLLSLALGLGFGDGKMRGSESHQSTAISR